MKYPKENQYHKTRRVISLIGGEIAYDESEPGVVVWGKFKVFKFYRFYYDRIEKIYHIEDEVALHSPMLTAEFKKSAFYKYFRIVKWPME